MGRFARCRILSTKIARERALAMAVVFGSAAIARWPREIIEDLPTSLGEALALAEDSECALELSLDGNQQAVGCRTCLRLT